MYLSAGEVIIFATQIDRNGICKDKIFSYKPSQNLEFIVVQIRQESDSKNFENRMLDVDNFAGRIELRRYRIGILEKDKIPLRCFAGEKFFNNMDQCDLEISVLLNYRKKADIRDFEEYVNEEELFLQSDNYWKLEKRWKLPKMVEQNSLLKVEDFEKFKGKILKNEENGENGDKRRQEVIDMMEDASISLDSFSYTQVIDSSSLEPFKRYIDLNYSMIPLCKAFINGIFYTDFSLSEKVNLVWDTLNFFENLSENFYLNDNCLESETLSYFIHTIAEKSWPSLPHHSTDNLVSLLVNGRVPTIHKAILHIEGKVINLKKLLISSLNHSHFATGQRHLDFSKPAILEAVQDYVLDRFPKIDKIESGVLYIATFNNLGVQNHTILLKMAKRGAKTKQNIESALEMKNLRLIVENQRTRVTRERYESVIPRCGLFAHLYQLEHVFEAKSARFRVNAFVFVNEEYFEAVVVHTEKEMLELYEDYPEWDRGLFGQRMGPGEYRCFLVIRPWNLFIAKENYIIFL